MSMSSTRVLKAKNSGGMPQLVCGGYSFDQLGEDLKLLKISGGGGNPEGEWSICSLVILEVV